MSDRATIEQHVGVELSGYLDGELTQQDRQRVRLHCESCSDCAAELERLQAMREVMSGARLTDLDRDKWRETMNDTAVSASRGLGWLLFAGGILIAVGIAIVAFFTSAGLSAIEMLMIGGIYGGLFLLFISVLRQRLIERKTDKYKDVEI